MIDEFYSNKIQVHYDFKDFYSIHSTRYRTKGYGSNLWSFNKIKGFDIFFEQIGNKSICNAVTSKTFGYRLRLNVVEKLLKLPYFKNPRKYTRGKMKEVIKYKGVNNLYDTKKELIKGENLTRRQVDNNIEKYVFEVKELFSEVYRHKVPNGKVFPDYEHIIPLNVEDCNALIEEFKTDIEKGNKLKLAQHEVFALLRYVRRFERDDFLSIIKYKRKSGGRLFNIYSEDNLPIQSFSKEVRKIIFKGQYYYDIETSAPTILQQLSVKYFNYDMPKVRYYIQNKEYYRNLLVENVGLTYKEAKSFLTAIFFGASLNDNFFLEGSSSFSKLYGVGKIREIMEKVPLVVDLYVELREFIKKYGKYLKEKNVKKGKDGKLYLHNSRGASKEVDLNNWNNAKAILFQYFGYESQILDCLIKKYQHSLLLFDGFISKEDINTAEMSELVKKELGFDIKFSKEEL